jgi:hypothetical protein
MGSGLACQMEEGIEKDLLWVIFEAEDAGAAGAAAAAYERIDAAQ